MFEIYIYHFYLYTFNVFLSCLPSWSNDNVTEVAYIWCVAVIGGLIPAVLMMISNIFVVNTLYVVSNLNLKEIATRLEA